MKNFIKKTIILASLAGCIASPLQAAWYNPFSWDLNQTWHMVQATASSVSENIRKSSIGKNFGANVVKPLGSFYSSYCANKVESLVSSFNNHPFLWMFAGLATTVGIVGFAIKKHIDKRKEEEDRKRKEEEELKRKEEEERKRKEEEEQKKKEEEEQKKKEEEERKRKEKKEQKKKEEEERKRKEKEERKRKEEEEQKKKEEEQIIEENQKLQKLLEETKKNKDEKIKKATKDLNKLKEEERKHEEKEKERQCKLNIIKQLSKEYQQDEKNKKNVNKLICEELVDNYIKTHALPKKENVNKDQENEKMFNDIKKNLKKAITKGSAELHAIQTHKPNYQPKNKDCAAYLGHFLYYVGLLNSSLDGGPKEHAMIISDPDEKLYNYFMNKQVLEKYTRISSHLKKFETSKHAGIDFECGTLPTDKGTMLIIYLKKEKQLFIKMEGAGVKNLKDGFLHGVDYIKSVAKKINIVRNALGLESDDAPTNQKERVPEVVVNAYKKIIKEYYKNDTTLSKKLSKATCAICLMYKKAKELLNAETKKKDVSINLKQALKKFITDLEKDYDHLETRIGREIIIELDEIRPLLWGYKTLQDSKDPAANQRALLEEFYTLRRNIVCFKEKAENAPTTTALIKQAIKFYKAYNVAGIDSWKDEQLKDTGFDYIKNMKCAITYGCLKATDNDNTYDLEQLLINPKIIEPSFLKQEAKKIQGKNDITSLLKNYKKDHIERIINSLGKNNTSNNKKITLPTILKDEGFEETINPLFEATLAQLFDTSSGIGRVNYFAAIDQNFIHFFKQDWIEVEKYTKEKISENTKKLIAQAYITWQLLEKKIIKEAHNAGFVTNENETIKKRLAQIRGVLDNALKTQPSDTELLQMNVNVATKKQWLKEKKNIIDNQLFVALKKEEILKQLDVITNHKYYKQYAKK